MWKMCLYCNVSESTQGTPGGTTLFFEKNGNTVFNTVP